MLNVINYIGKGSANAKTAYQISGEMSVILGQTIKHTDVRKAIKADRHQGIIWNNKGSYIETDRNKVKAFVNKRVTSSMYGYITGMKNLSHNLGEDINLHLNPIKIG